MTSCSRHSLRFLQLCCGFSLVAAVGCGTVDAPPRPAQRGPAAVDAAGDHRSAADSGIEAAIDSAEPFHPPDAAGVPDAHVDTGAPTVDTGAPTVDTGAPTVDTGAPTVDTGAPTADTGAPTADADAAGGPIEISQVVGWSVRKRLETATGAAILLEEVLTDLASASPKPSRVMLPATGGAPERSWTAPPGAYISDFCVHPSGATSVLLLGAGGSISLARLGTDLTLLATQRVHDPSIANDPHVSDAGALDLVANQLTLDAARIASVGEDIVAAVFSSWNSVIAYRASFSNGAWSAPARTLIEPPVPLVPNLPIGGSFDTFGAITAWFRCLLDVDEDGSAYVAVWANPRRIREHVNVFSDALEPLPDDAGNPQTRDSDVLLTKLAPGGARLWSRVVGSVHEDEPYALRARHGAVAVVGRARRAPGFDNTFWDVFIAATSSEGDPAGARTVALDQSSIALAVDSLSGGGWILGGSDGWAQNPGGLSVGSFGVKLLLELPSLGAAPIRVSLPNGPRHNEIRTVRVDGARIAFGGHEDGPIMHTGDGDVSLIRAVGVIGSVPVAQR